MEKFLYFSLSGILGVTTSKAENAFFARAFLSSVSFASNHGFEPMNLKLKHTRTHKLYKKFQLQKEIYRFELNFKAKISIVDYEFLVAQSKHTQRIFL